MKTSFLMGTALLLVAGCHPKKSEPETVIKLHGGCLLLKQPIDNKVYGVSLVWSQKGQRYALVSDVVSVDSSVLSNGAISTKFKYDDESTGIIQVDGTVPTSLQEKISFLKLVNGRWEFKN